MCVCAPLLLEVAVQEALTVQRHVLLVCVRCNGRPSLCRVMYKGLAGTSLVVAVAMRGGVGDHGFLLLQLLLLGLGRFRKGHDLRAMYWGGSLWPVRLLWCRGGRRVRVDVRCMVRTSMPPTDFFLKASVLYRAPRPLLCVYVCRVVSWLCAHVCVCVCVGGLVYQW